MRTTLELDEELITAAKGLAAQQGVSLGRVISNLALQSLRPQSPPKVRNGIRVFEREPGAPPATLEFINALRDEE
ncbi:MAG: hypothetical protein JO022_03885 [Acidobacteriaceae bacterium]|nr:hypothetical protein [Acidobacteriaceae bacterium]